jgi:hypothetical protein
MKLVRFGLLMLLVVRVAFLWPRLRRFALASSTTIHGERVYYRIGRASRSGERHTVALGVDAPGGPRFAMHRESAWDRFGKLLGLSREWQAEEPEFDSAVFVVGDDPRLLETLARDAELRRLAATLVTSTAGELYCAGGRLWLERPARGPGSSEEPDLAAAQAVAREVLPRLVELRDRLGPAVDEARKATSGLPFLLADLLVAFCVLVGAIGALGFLWEDGVGTPRQMVDDLIEVRAASVFAGASAIVALLLSTLLRQASFTHLVALELLLVGLPGAWLSSHTALVVLNQRLDAAAPQVIQVKVQRAWSEVSRGRRGRKRRSFYVSAVGWPDPRVPGVLQVSASLHRQARTGGCIEAVWHHGYFGDPWVSDWRGLGTCAAAVQQADDASALLAAGRAALRVRNHDEAIRSLRQALAILPGEPDTLADLAVARRLSGDRAGAREDAGRACDLGSRLSCDLVGELDGRLGDPAR